MAGTLNLPGNPTVRGYEIHMGVTVGPALTTPAATLDGHADGAQSADGQISPPTATASSTNPPH